MRDVKIISREEQEALDDKPLTFKTEKEALDAAYELSHFQYSLKAGKELPRSMDRSICRVITLEELRAENE